MRGPSAVVAEQDLVYGTDDRLEYFSVGLPLLQQRQAQSTVALIDRTLVSIDPDGIVALPSDTYGELYNLCPGEPFADQPSVAQCSGILIDRDMVLTAAHCLRYTACADWSVVLGFYYDSLNHLNPIRKDDVFSCSRVIAMHYGATGTDEETDYAIFSLDRPVGPDRKPAMVYPADEPISSGEQVTVIGHGAGLPSKVDSGARVAASRADTLDYFLTNSDTFHGSSGSGVYDDHGRLRGVMARGGEDYEETSNHCQRARHVADDPLGAEEKVTYVARAREGLCSSGTPNRRLCTAATGLSGCGVAYVSSRRPLPGWCVLCWIIVVIRWKVRRQMVAKHTEPEQRREAASKTYTSST